MRLIRTQIAIAIAMALTLGCQGQPGPTSVKPKGTPKPKPSASDSIIPSASPSTGIVGGGVAPIPLSEPPRVVGTGTQAVELIGKVKLISDKGLGIISNNTGSLVSNNGGGLISDKGLGYQTLQAGGTSAVPESTLAEAQIEVLDAAGNVLVTADQKPITATTDATGNYKLKTNLPNENLLLRVRLFNGGQLFAFITKDRATATVNLDTASSLGTAYVMAKYVNKQQAVLNKLPGSEVDKLQAEMETARVHLAATMPTYTPTDMVASAEQLRTKAPQLNAAMERIAAILLAGQANLGNGLPATQVALSAPSGLAVDAAGNVYVTEGSAGRIRMIAKDGNIYTVAGVGAPAPRDGSLGITRNLMVGPDGSLYTVKRLAGQAVRLPPAAAPVVIAGNGQQQQGAVGGKATETALHRPDKVFLAADGKVYVSEFGTFVKNLPARILVVDTAGKIDAVPMPDARWKAAEIHGFTVAPDGTVWAIAKDVATAPVSKLLLARLKPGGSWEFLRDDLNLESNIEMTVGPDNALYASCQSQSQILKFDDQGKSSVFAGAQRSGFSGDGGPATAALLNFPRAIAFGPDGTCYVADEGNGLVRAIGKDGIIKTIAGTTGLTQVGDALTVSINQPVGMTLDPQGRLVVTEAASHTIKRLDGNQLTVIAGTTAGFLGDGGAATAAAFLRPNGIAYHNNELYILDSKNNRLRKIDTAGNITTLAGGRGGQPGADRIPAADATLDSATGIAISPEGIPYWTDNSSHVVMRLKDGYVERVAGALYGQKGNEGDGGQATDAKLSGPSGIAFDKAGNLFVADSGNLRIRKIDKQGVITTVAGLDKAGMMALLATGTAGTQNNAPGTASALWGPFGLQTDDAGNLYIGEAGTISAGAFGDGGEGNVLGFDTSLLPPELLPKTYARIRKLKPDGTLVNVTGPGTSVLDDTSGDNMLSLPVAIIIDGQGRMVIGDSGLNQLKMLPKGSF